MRKLRKKIASISEQLGIKKFFVIAFEKIISIKQTAKVYLFYSKDSKIKSRYNVSVYSIQDTMEILIRERISVSRFGDGEFKIIENRDIGFQSHDRNLRDDLIDLCCCPEKYKNVIICMPGFFYDESIYTHTHWIYFRKLLLSNREKWYAMLNPYYSYGNADITRCYVELKDKSQSNKIFDMWKSVWEKRDILIIEGNETRLGIGNDLFRNARSISRVIAPSNDAYSCIDDICSYVSNNIKKENLILIALGPTATVMSYKLAKMGFWTIDIGNIDKEYEWMKSRTKKKVRNPIKYSGEVKGGTEVQECNDPKYLSEIIKRIGC